MLITRPPAEIRLNFVRRPNSGLVERFVTRSLKVQSSFKVKLVRIEVSTLNTAETR